MLKYLNIYPRENVSPKLVHEFLYIRNSHKCKQHKYPFADEWINKMWYTHTMEYIHSLQRNKILTNNLTTQMNFMVCELYLNYLIPPPQIIRLKRCHLKDCFSISAFLI